LLIHSRRKGDRRGCGQANRSQKIVCQTMSKPGHKIGRGRSHQHLIRPSGKFNVTHAGLGCFIEQLGMDWIPGYSLESQRSYERQCAMAHNNTNFGTGIPQTPDQISRLVRGDSPGHAEKNPPGN
jgi:hypothetical protein